MVSQSRTRKHSVRLAWTVFVLAIVGWFILRGAYGMGVGCDLLVAIALASQAWLLFLTVDKHQ